MDGEQAQRGQFEHELFKNNFFNRALDMRPLAGYLTWIKYELVIRILQKLCKAVNYIDKYNRIYSSLQVIICKYISLLVTHKKTHGFCLIDSVTALLRCAFSRYGFLKKVFSFLSIFSHSFSLFLVFIFDISSQCINHAYWMVYIS